MLIAVSDAGDRRFEVDESVDGFVVSRRDLDTGEDIAERLFRTAPAAFAYAEWAAAMSRGAGLDDDPAERRELRALLTRFAQARDRLRDEGVPGDVIEAWRLAEAKARRVSLH